MFEMANFLLQKPTNHKYIQLFVVNDKDKCVRALHLYLFCSCDLFSSPLTSAIITYFNTLLYILSPQ